MITEGLSKIPSWVRNPLLKYGLSHWRHIVAVVVATSSLLIAVAVVEVWKVGGWIAGFKAKGGRKTGRNGKRRREADWR